MLYVVLINFKADRYFFHKTNTKEFQLSTDLLLEYTLSELSWGKWIAMSITQNTKLQAVIQGPKFNPYLTSWKWIFQYQMWTNLKQSFV